MKNEMIADPVKRTGTYKKTEIGPIPDCWEIMNLGHVGEVKMCRRVFNHETSSHGQIPFFKIGTFGKEPDAFISQSLYNLYRQKFSFPQPGEILISAAGTIGRTIVYNGEDAYYQDSNIVWLSNDEKLITNEFLFYVLQIAKYNTEGGTIQRLYNSILKSTKFICPPLSEQTAIAEALSDADAMISSLEKLIEKKKKIKQGAMQELLSSTGSDGKLKEGWVEMNLTDIVNYIHGKAHERDIVEEGRYTVVNSKFISSNGQVAKYSNLNNCPARKGDVLTVLSDLPNGKALAKCFLVDLDNKYAVNQRVCIWRTKGADPVFLSYILNRHKYFLGLDDGVSQTHILNKHIEGFRLMFPTDLKYQQESGIVLRELDEEIRLLNTKLSKCQLMKQGMMQKLLTGKIRLV